MSSRGGTPNVLPPITTLVPPASSGGDAALPRRTGGSSAPLTPCGAPTAFTAAEGRPVGSIVTSGDSFETHLISSSPTQQVASQQSGQATHGGSLRRSSSERKDKVSLSGSIEASVSPRPDSPSSQNRHAATGGLAAVVLPGTKTMPLRGMKQTASTGSLDKQGGMSPRSEIIRGFPSYDAGSEGSEHRRTLLEGSGHITNDTFTPQTGNIIYFEAPTTHSHGGTTKPMVVTHSTSSGLVHYGAPSGLLLTTPHSIQSGLELPSPFAEAMSAHPRQTDSSAASASTLPLPEIVGSPVHSYSRSIGPHYTVGVTPPPGPAWQESTTTSEAPPSPPHDHMRPALHLSPAVSTSGITDVASTSNSLPRNQPKRTTGSLGALSYDSYPRPQRMMMMRSDPVNSYQSDGLGDPTDLDLIHSARGVPQDMTQQSVGTWEVQSTGMYSLSREGGPSNVQPDPPVLGTSSHPDSPRRPLDGSVMLLDETVGPSQAAAKGASIGPSSALLPRQLPALSPTPSKTGQPPGPNGSGTTSSLSSGLQPVGGARAPVRFSPYSDSASISHVISAGSVVSKVDGGYGSVLGSMPRDSAKVITDGSTTSSSGNPAPHGVTVVTTAKPFGQPQPSDTASGIAPMLQLELDPAGTAQSLALIPTRVAFSPPLAPGRTLASVAGTGGHPHGNAAYGGGGGYRSGLMPISDSGIVGMSPATSNIHQSSAPWISTSSMPSSAGGESPARMELSAPTVSILAAPILVPGDLDGGTDRDSKNGGGLPKGFTVTKHSPPEVPTNVGDARVRSSSATAAAEALTMPQFPFSNSPTSMKPKPGSSTRPPQTQHNSAKAMRLAKELDATNDGKISLPFAPFVPMGLPPAPGTKHHHNQHHQQQQQSSTSAPLVSMTSNASGDVPPKGGEKDVRVFAGVIGGLGMGLDGVRMLPVELQRWVFGPHSKEPLDGLQESLMSKREGNSLAVFPTIPMAPGGVPTNVSFQNMSFIGAVEQTPLQPTAANSSSNLNAPGFAGNGNTPASNNLGLAPWSAQNSHYANSVAANSSEGADETASGGVASRISHMALSTALDSNSMSASEQSTYSRVSSITTYPPVPLGGSINATPSMTSAPSLGHIGRRGPKGPGAPTGSRAEDDDVYQLAAEENAKSLNQRQPSDGMEDRRESSVSRKLSDDPRRLAAASSSSGSPDFTSPPRRQGDPLVAGSGGGVVGSGPGAEIMEHFQQHRPKLFTNNNNNGAASAGPSKSPTTATTAAGGAGSGDMNIHGSMTVMHGRRESGNNISISSANTAVSESYYVRTNTNKEFLESTETDPSRRQSNVDSVSPKRSVSVGSRRAPAVVASGMTVDGEDNRSGQSSLYPIVAAGPHGRLNSNDPLSMRSPTEGHPETLTAAPRMDSSHQLEGTQDGGKYSSSPSREAGSDKEHLTTSSHQRTPQDGGTHDATAHRRPFRWGDPLIVTVVTWNMMGMNCGGVHGEHFEHVLHCKRILEGTEREGELLLQQQQHQQQQRRLQEEIKPRETTEATNSTGQASVPTARLVHPDVSANFSQMVQPVGHIFCVTSQENGPYVDASCSCCNDSGEEVGTVTAHGKWERFLHRLLNPPAVPEAIVPEASKATFQMSSSTVDLPTPTTASGYTRVASDSLMAIHTALFVRNDVLPFIEHHGSSLSHMPLGHAGVATSVVPTGLFGGRLGNKGGVGIALKLVPPANPISQGPSSDPVSTTPGAGQSATSMNDSTSDRCGHPPGLSLLFVGAHLAAHQNATKERNRDYHRILERMSFPDTICTRAVRRSAATVTTSAELLSGTTQPPAAPDAGTDRPTKPNASDAFDVTFFGGDLNYRVNGKKKAIEHIVALHEDLRAVLSANDQLSLEKRNKRVFEGFSEGPLQFRPTYKYDMDGEMAKGQEEPAPSTAPPPPAMPPSSRRASSAATEKLRNKLKKSGVGLSLDTYDSGKKQRLPAYCDRVLYRSQLYGDHVKPPPLEERRGTLDPTDAAQGAALARLQQHNAGGGGGAVDTPQDRHYTRTQLLLYDDAGEVRFSDHRPVVAMFCLTSPDLMPAASNIVASPLSGSPNNVITPTGGANASDDEALENLVQTWRCKVAARDSNKTRNACVVS